MEYEYYKRDEHPDMIIPKGAKWCQNPKISNYEWHDCNGLVGARLGILNGSNLVLRVPIIPTIAWTYNGESFLTGGK